MLNVQLFVFVVYFFQIDGLLFNCIHNPIVIDDGHSKIIIYDVNIIIIVFCCSYYYALIYIYSGNYVIQLIELDLNTITVVACFCIVIY